MVGWFVNNLPHVDMEDVNLFVSVAICVFFGLQHPDSGHRSYQV